MKMKTMENKKDVLLELESQKGTPTTRHDAHPRKWTSHVVVTPMLEKSEIEYYYYYCTPSQSPFITLLVTLLSCTHYYHVLGFITSSTNWMRWRPWHRLIIGVHPCNILRHKRVNWKMCILVRVVHPTSSVWWCWKTTSKVKMVFKRPRQVNSKAACKVTYYIQVCRFSLDGL